MSMVPPEVSPVEALALNSSTRTELTESICGLIQAVRPLSCMFGTPFSSSSFDEDSPPPSEKSSAVEPWNGVAATVACFILGIAP